MLGGVHPSTPFPFTISTLLCECIYLSERSEESIYTNTQTPKSNLNSSTMNFYDYFDSVAVAVLFFVTLPCAAYVLYDAVDFFFND